MKILSGLKKMMVDFYHARQTRAMREMIVNKHHDVSQIDNEEIHDFRKEGFSLAESSVYKLSSANYHDYITTWESYQPRLINNPYFPVSDDKYLFYLVFSHFIKTPKVYALVRNGKVFWLDKEHEGVELGVFFLSKGGGVIKDRGGCDGFGVYVFTVSDDGQLSYRESPVTKEQLDKIVSDCKDGMIQERMEQGSFENEIYDKSVNTIRIVTMKKKGGEEHEIVAALQRVGNDKSRPVDNFNQGGGSCLINVETGKIGPMKSMLYKDAEGDFLELDSHPDSGTMIRGRIIPNWQKIKNQIVDLTRKLPFFECIAWDVVLQDDGIAVIETNMKSSLNVFQIHQPMRNTLLGEKYREHGWLVDMN